MVAVWWASERLSLMVASCGRGRGVLPMRRGGRCAFGQVWCSGGGWLAVVAAVGGGVGWLVVGKWMSERLSLRAVACGKGRGVLLVRWVGR